MSESGCERERGEWRVGERRSGMQQQGGQLMDDIGERGEGECYSFYLVRASPGTDIREVKSVTEQDDKYTDIPLPLNAITSQGECGISGMATRRRRQR